MKKILAGLDKKTEYFDDPISLDCRVRCMLLTLQPRGVSAYPVFYLNGSLEFNLETVMTAGADFVRDNFVSFYGKRLYVFCDAKSEQMASFFLMGMTSVEWIGFTLHELSLDPLIASMNKGEGGRFPLAAYIREHTDPSYSDVTMIEALARSLKSRDISSMPDPAKRALKVLLGSIDDTFSDDEGSETLDVFIRRVVNGLERHLSLVASGDSVVVSFVSSWVFSVLVQAVHGKCVHSRDIVDNAFDVSPLEYLKVVFPNDYVDYSSVSREVPRLGRMNLLNATLSPGNFADCIYFQHAQVGEDNRSLSEAGVVTALEEGQRFARNNSELFEDEELRIRVFCSEDSPCTFETAENFLNGVRRVFPDQSYVVERDPLLNDFALGDYTNGDLDAILRRYSNEDETVPVYERISSYLNGFDGGIDASAVDPLRVMSGDIDAGYGENESDTLGFFLRRFLDAMERRKREANADGMFFIFFTSRGVMSIVDGLLNEGGFSSDLWAHEAREMKPFDEIWV